MSLAVLLALHAPTPVAASATVPSQPTRRAGGLTLMSADDPTVTVADGRSSTQFAVRLPEGATCPGDSAHDQWRVQSFIVPASVDPATLTFDYPDLPGGPLGPDGSHEYALFFADTRPYVDILTQANAVAGQPGRIDPPGPLSFAVFPPGTLPDGTYNIGIVCTYFRQPAKYWDARIELRADPADQPGQLTWRLSDAPPSAPRPTSIPWNTIVVIALVVIAMGSAAWFVRLQRQSVRVGLSASRPSDHLEPPDEEAVLVTDKEPSS